jgi:glycolate oxidase FAD binding subunit
VLYDWGGGLVWLLMAPGTDLRARIGGVWAMRRWCVRGKPWRARCSSPNLRRGRADRGIAGKFDPRGLFNPGLMANAS